jgi:hypothetical protein
VRPTSRLRQRMSRPRADRDTGTTLIDVVISTTLMSFCMAMFTTGILQMYRFANKNETISTAQSQLHIAFIRLEKELRYAAGISDPGLVGLNPYVEYLTTNSGNPVCAELRLSVGNQQLQRRTWTHGAAVVAPTAWIPLVSGVTTAAPFTVLAADATYNFQRLQVRLVSSSGAGGTATSTQIDVTFTALNTSLGTPNPSVCTEGRAIP